MRPADAKETVAAWRFIVEHRDGPVALLLSRQKLPILRSGPPGRGPGCLRHRRRGEPQIILIASGSEVSGPGSHEILDDEGISARVVSMPSWELFEAQPQAYRDTVLPPDLTARVAVEAGVPWAGNVMWGPRVRSLP